METFYPIDEAIRRPREIARQHRSLSETTTSRWRHYPLMRRYKDLVISRGNTALSETDLSEKESKKASYIFYYIILFYYSILIYSFLFIFNILITRTLTLTLILTLTLSITITLTHFADMRFARSLIRDRWDLHTHWSVTTIETWRTHTLKQLNPKLGDQIDIL